MSAPIKPNRPAEVKHVAAPPLTKEEESILHSFRTMDARGKTDIAKLAARIAERHPNVPRPTLRLVSRGAQ
jgi:hypothetical protein